MLFAVSVAGLNCFRHCCYAFSMYVCQIILTPIFRTHIGQFQYTGFSAEAEVLRFQTS